MTATRVSSVLPCLFAAIACGARDARDPAPTALAERAREAPSGSPPVTADAGSAADTIDAADARSADAAVRTRLLPTDVQRIVHASMPSFRACFEEGIRTSPSLSSRVVVRFVISPDGTVTKSRDAGSDLPDAHVVSCVVAKVRALRFPTTTGPPLTVTYPFVMTPGD